MFNDIAQFFGFSLVNNMVLLEDHEEKVKRDEVFEKLYDTAPKNQARFISKVQVHMTKSNPKTAGDAYLVVKFNKKDQIRIMHDGTWKLHQR